MTKVSNIVKCPNCGITVPWLAKNNFKPFCSERCKMVDLGEWMTEEKVIPGESLVDDFETDE